MIEIPLTSDAEQFFTILIDGEVYDMTVMLNSRTQTWSISITLGDDTLIQGLSLVSGVDLLSPHNFPIHNMYVINLNDNSLDPGIDNLGEVSKLFLVEEFTAIISSVSDNYHASSEDFVKLYGSI